MRMFPIRELHVNIAPTQAEGRISSTSAVTSNQVKSLNEQCQQVLS